MGDRRTKEGELPKSREKRASWSDIQLGKNGKLFFRSRGWSLVILAKAGPVEGTEVTFLWIKA